MLLRTSSILVLWLIFSLFSYGQADTNVQKLPVFIKTSSPFQISLKKDFVSESQIRSISKEVIRQNVYRSFDHLLNNYSAIFVKQYGVNNFATLNIRGSSAAQSQVLWNAVPMNSGATGISDLNLLHVAAFDEIDIFTGGQSALYGSGVVGGALMLQSRPKDYRHGSLDLNVGSFNTSHLSLNVTYPFKRFNIAARFFRKSERNNFKFYQQNDSNSRMTNAERRSTGAMLDATFEIGKVKWERPLTLNYHFWMQNDFRAIPPALFESESKKTLRDSLFRNVLSIYQSIRPGLKWYTTLNMNFDRQHYEDSLTFINKRYLSRQYYGEVGLKYERVIKQWKHRWSVNVPFQNNQLLNMVGRQDFTQNRVALNSNYSLKKDHWSFLYSSRLERLGKEWLPLVYSATGDYRLFDQKRATLNLFLSTNKSYRIPTLNELYYFPGGNKNLKPEVAQSFEAGLQYDWQRQAKNATQVEYALTYFNRKVKDWIYWLGGSVWTPHNISYVNSRGWQHDLTIKQQIAQWSLQNTSHFLYTIARTTSSVIDNDNSVGKQIPYTPRYLLRNNFTAKCASWSLGCNYSYTGYRFTNLDESLYLRPYHLLNIAVAKGFQINSQLVKLSFSVDNLLNAHYQTVQNRPMPLRSFNVGVRYLFF